MVLGIIKIKMVDNMPILAISIMALLVMLLGLQMPYYYEELVGLKVVQVLADLNMATGMALVHLAMTQMINTG